MAELNSTEFDLTEWLEADGLGGFASGTVSGIRTRRYHALLLTSASPPTDRRVLVGGIEATVVTVNGSFDISTQHYQPGVVHPHGCQYLRSFTDELWPTWTSQLPDGTAIQFELFVPRGHSAVVMRWQLTSAAAATDSGRTELIVRPLIAGRDYHSLHHENAAFNFAAEVNQEQITWSPYPDVPAITAITNARYAHSPDWYRQFRYSQEAARGLDCTEDLASPGRLHFELNSGPACLVLTDSNLSGVRLEDGESARKLVRRLEHAERTRRASFPTRLHRSAADYVVQRGNGKTIVAGYPWFTDWGRDTFIALRGICLAAGNIEDAGRILKEWSTAVSEGMLPNRFPDRGDEPEYNSVDASLWYIIAVHDYLTLLESVGQSVDSGNRTVLHNAVQRILQGYRQGTRFGIRMDADCLLSAGQPGVQLTWMDAKCGDWVVTPRVGKPVEIQALWINSLWIGSQIDPVWQPLFQQAKRSLQKRFTNPSGCGLFDVVDVDHVAGRIDDSIRPNQILCVGGLPLNLLTADQAGQVVRIVEERLLTPLGLRTLDPLHANYRGIYYGGVVERDGAYHQGTVWPWLMGPFVQAWLRVYGGRAEYRQLAAARFVQPFLDHLKTAGRGHVSEIADGNAPHHPRGCPFQAWSVGELMRMQQFVATSP